MAQDKDVPSHDKAAREQGDEIQNPQQLNSELARVSAATDGAGFAHYGANELRFLGFSGAN